MKSANGMGTISKLKGNRRKPYMLRSAKYFDEVEKKFKREVIGYYATRKEAEIDKIAYFNGDLDKKTISKNKEKGITFEQIYNKWLTTKGDVKKGTLTNYKTNFKRSEKLHKMEIKKINGIFLQELFNKLDLTNATLRNLKSFWTNIWDFAILNDFCDKNYPNFLKTPAIEKGNKTSDRERPFSFEEINILWEYIYKDKYKVADLILFLCYTGLRADELLNIKPKNVNLKLGYIEIENSKTNAGLRQVPISEKILPIVRKRLDFKNEFLFLRKDKEIFSYDTLDDHFRYTCKELNLSYHTLHDCRHTFATLLSDANVDREAIIKMIGHSNYKTTSKTYIHKSIEKLKNEVNKIG